MIYEKNINAAEEVRAFREYLGLTRKEFADWLSQFNVIGRNGTLYSVKTIEFWERGKRSVPEKVLRVIERNAPLEADKLYSRQLKDYTTDELLAEIKRRIEK